MAISTTNGKLALIEWDNPWEPGLPISPGTIGQDDKQQLLLGYPEVLWGAPAVVVPTVVENIGGGRYWLAPPRRQRTKKELLEERIRLGIIQAPPKASIKPILEAASAVVSLQKKDGELTTKQVIAELKQALMASEFKQDLSKTIRIAYNEAIKITLESEKLQSDEDEVIMMLMAIH